MTEADRTTPSWTVGGTSMEFQTTTGVWNDSAGNYSTSVGFGDHRGVVPLWVPYVVLTVFLLILVVISFVRFHMLRAAQNRQRLEAMADQLEKKAHTAALLAETRRNGLLAADGGEISISGVHSSAAPADFSGPFSTVTTPSSSNVPAYLDLFLSFSQTASVRCEQI